MAQLSVIEASRSCSQFKKAFLRISRPVGIMWKAHEGYFISLGKILDRGKNDCLIS
jgi:hypothetical protein